MIGESQEAAKGKGRTLDSTRVGKKQGERKKYGHM